ncbi:MAG: hypothetical protein U9P70_02855 [Patescibacteria group bacterium]|nr:hypothetical protein [Patescibacteria group bacterium]
MSFVVLVSFLSTFIFVRIYVSLGTVGIINDPYLYIKGYHVHHLNYGIFILAFAGVLALFFQNVKNRLKIGIIYGMGLGLTLDEFGMWFKLENDYWTRLSYDAVVIVGLVFASMVYIPSFWCGIVHHTEKGIERINSIKQIRRKKIEHKDE